MTKVNFAGFTCTPSREMYENGNTAIQLWDEEGPVATATVNLGDKLPEDEAFIKSYSENEGMLKALLEAGVVTEVLRNEPSGFVVATLCKLDLGKLSFRGKVK